MDNSKTPKDPRKEKLRDHRNPDSTRGLIWSHERHEQHKSARALSRSNHTGARRRRVAGTGFISQHQAG